MSVALARPDQQGRFRCTICSYAFRVDPPVVPLKGRAKCDECTRRFWTARDRAHRALTYAVRRGRLPRPDGFPCVDCGKPAVDYDHRDYEHVLRVEPTCRSCNLKRGQATCLHVDPVEFYGHA